MYLEHYQLKVKPFDISPRPDFLWLGEKHKEALAVLQYGITENMGFVLLTGDVGVGKTALIYKLMSRLDADTLVAHITDPGLETFDFFRILAAQFNLDRNIGSKGEFLIKLEAFLRQTHAEHKRVLLIVDEAQRLNDQLLDQIRVLSNIELSDRKLINIFLVGQPELMNILVADANRAFRQRIAITYHIDTLNEAETAQYIEHRLKQAGAAAPIFKPGAVREIHRYAGGYPRLINIICDHALVTGFAAGVRTIDAATIAECRNELAIPAHTPVRESAPPPAPDDKPAEAIAPKPAPVIAVARDTAAPAVSPMTAEPPPSARGSRRNANYALVAVAVILAVFIGYHWLQSGSSGELPLFVQKFARQDPHPPAQPNDTNGQDHSGDVAAPVFETDGLETLAPAEDRETVDTGRPTTMSARETPRPVPAPPVPVGETAAPLPAAPAVSPGSDRTTAAADPSPRKPQPDTDTTTVAPAVRADAAPRKEPQEKETAPAAAPAPTPDTGQVRAAQRAETGRTRPTPPPRQALETAQPEKERPQTPVGSETPRASTPAPKVAQAALPPPPAPEQPARPEPLRSEAVESDLKNRLKTFLQAYCATYEAMNLDAFRNFFAPDALENGEPFKSLLPIYERNFAVIASIEYQIELQRYSYDTDQETVDIEGHFSLKWLPPDNRWRANGGTIAMRLAEKESSFLIHRLDYHGGEPPTE